MPLIKRKAIELLPPPEPPKEGEPEPEVFYLAATGEIFNDYDSYTIRLAFYNQPIFQCELTGKVNLTYFQATDSERQEAIMLHRRFPESLKGPILRSVQFTITGRLDDLVNAVHDRFVDRYFGGEQVYVDLSGERYYASIKTVYPPRSLLRQHQEAALAAQRSQKKQKQNPDSDSDLTDEEPEYPPIDAEAVIHRIGTDLDEDITKANELDNPDEYLYAIQLSDEDGKFTGSLMEARAKALKRDRLTFSKTILKKYLKEATVRETTVASPWVVRHVLAQRYGIDINPSEAVIKKNQEQKDAKLGKRRKVPTKEEEEAAAAKNGEPPSKKRKGADDAPAEKKKVIKYPIEDLDIPPISTKELKYTSSDGFARIRCRPIPSRALPVPKDLFEPLMMVYYFCIAVGKPLGLSPFTLDDFEAALRHNTHDPPCTLVSEMHGSLLNCIMRDGSYSKDLAPAALETKALEKKEKVKERERLEKGRSASRGRSEDVDELNSNLDENEEKDKSKEESSKELEVKKEDGVGELSTVHDHDDELTDDEEEYSEEEKSVMMAATQIGKGWEKRILKPEDGRPGWERALVGCLLKRATTATLPRLVGILSQLTGISHPEGILGRPDGVFDCDTYESEVQRYPTLSLGDKLAALQFLCELAVMTRAVRGFFDECDANLTELRKEKLDFTRVRKKLIEDRAAFEASKAANGGAEPTEQTNGTPAAEAEPASRAASVDAGGDTSMKAADDSSVSVPPQDPPEVVPDSESEKDELDSDQDELDEEDESLSDAGSGDMRPTSRQAKLREQTMKREAAAAARSAEANAERKIAAAKKSEQKAKKSEQQRIEEEESRTNMREEIFERDFRKYFNAARMRPLGKDRFHDSYWWFDGVGNANLVQAGQVLYGTGRIFIQGPSQDDWEMVKKERKISEVEERKKDECLEGGMLGVGEWAVFEEAEEIDGLIAWLRNKGRRELALRNELLKFRNYIEPGMKKRQADRASELAAAETRRSTRKYEKQPYMLYRNMIAK